jgi:hypothetical protein
LSTALAIVQNEYGFALAADSFHCDAGDGHVISEDVQKIFPLKTHLAYCLCGTITYNGADNSGNKKCLFDYAAVVPKILTTVDEFATLTQFADDFGRRLHKKLRRAVSQFRDPVSGSAYISFVGYYKGVAGFLILESSVVEGVIKRPVLHDRKPAYDSLEGCFPSTMLKQFYSDPMFIAFRDVDSTHKGIERAVEIARQAVTACYDPAVRSRYPECQVVGGKIRIAKITYDRGFESIC